MEVLQLLNLAWDFSQKVHATSVRTTIRVATSWKVSMGARKWIFEKSPTLPESKISKKTSPNVLTRFPDKYWILSFKNIRNFQNRFSSLRDILISKLWNFENFGFRPDLYPRSYRDFNIKWLKPIITIWEVAQKSECKKNCVRTFIYQHLHVRIGIVHTYS